jgi:hypothetical protein
MVKYTRERRIEFSLQTNSFLRVTIKCKQVKEGKKEERKKEDEVEVEDTMHRGVWRIENGIPGEKSERYK